MAENDGVGVIIVPGELAAQVQKFAEKLAEEQSAEVEGFRAGLPDMGSFGSVLGRPISPVLGATTSGTGCTGTGGLRPTDFNCEDDT
jgi:hypothetical protein